MNDEVRIVRRNGRKTEKSINAHAQLERPFVPRRRETRKLINARCRFATMALCKKVQEIHLLLTLRIRYVRKFFKYNFRF